MHSAKNVGRKRLGRLPIVGGTGTSNLVQDRKRSCQIENRTSHVSSQASVSPGVGNEDLSFSASFACDLEGDLDLMSALDKMEKNFKPSSTRPTCGNKDQPKTNVSVKSRNNMGSLIVGAVKSSPVQTPKQQTNTSETSSKENRFSRGKTNIQRKRSISKSPAFLPDDGVWTSPLGMSTPQNPDLRKSLKSSLNTSKRKSGLSSQKKSNLTGTKTVIQNQTAESKSLKTPVTNTSRVTRSSTKKNNSRIQKEKAVLPGLNTNSDTPVRGHVGNKNNRSDFFKSLFIDNTSLDDLSLSEGDIMKHTTTVTGTSKKGMTDKGNKNNQISNKQGHSEKPEEKIAGSGDGARPLDGSHSTMPGGKITEREERLEIIRQTTTEEQATETSSGNKGTIQIQPGTSENMLALSSWGLPEPVLKQYHQRGITHMFDWQAECLLQGNVLGGGNLVYSAPTSAGKTMVAELLVLKRIMEIRKKAIIILPFVSVTREKMFYLQELYQDAGIRVSGFMGSYAPAGGFSSVDVAVCTIEKGNGIINRCLEENRLDKIGIIVVDELHLIGDPHRGYLLELLLTKVNYMVKKSLQQTAQQDVAPISVQIVGMSATLPNLDLLAHWLDADLYRTDYRPVPLTECVKIGTALYDNNMALIRDIDTTYHVKGDPDHVVPLCIETIRGGHSILIFCPTKNWCEKLAETVARELYNLLRDPSVAVASVSGGSEVPADVLVIPLDRSAVRDVVEQLKRTPVGVDNILGCTVPFGVAYHHAGLTFDERDIVEGAFRQGILKVLIATSTLSSGVNLPARRVLVRTPVFHGQLIDFLTYKQMIGRAGRKGVDTAGESILLCKPSEKSKAAKLLDGALPPVQSALIRDQGEELSSSMKRAILEVVVSGVAMAPSDVAAYASCTLLAASLPAESGQTQQLIDQCMQFLQENEFVCMQKITDNKGVECDRFVPTQLGAAVLASSLSPDEGLIVFSELQRARKCFVLENELHIIYQVTPIYAQGIGGAIDWYTYFCLWEALSPGMKKVAELAGVKESFLARAVQGRVPTKTAAQLQLLRIHKRFYTALALHDLVQEMPLNAVTKKYNCNKGQLQSLQQSAATFAGMVTVFCARLGWSNLELILSQFQNRLTFGVQRELCDLVRISSLNGQRARVMFNGGYQTVAALASAHPADVEALLKNSAPFQSMKRQDQESDWDVQERCKARCIYLTGRKGVTEYEAACVIIDEAKGIIQEELGGLGIQWKTGDTSAVVTSPAHIQSPVLTSPAPVVGHRNLSLLGKRRSRSTDKKKRSPAHAADHRPSVNCVISPPPPVKQARMEASIDIGGTQSKSSAENNQSNIVTLSIQSKSLAESNQSKQVTQSNYSKVIDIQSKQCLVKEQTENIEISSNSNENTVILSRDLTTAAKTEGSRIQIKGNVPVVKSSIGQESSQRKDGQPIPGTSNPSNPTNSLSLIKHMKFKANSSGAVSETKHEGVVLHHKADTALSSNANMESAQYCLGKNTKTSLNKINVLNKSSKVTGQTSVSFPSGLQCDKEADKINQVLETPPERPLNLLKEQSVRTVTTEVHVCEPSKVVRNQSNEVYQIGNTKITPEIRRKQTSTSISKVSDKRSPNLFSGGAVDNLDDDFADSFMLDTQTAIDIIKNTKKTPSNIQEIPNINCDPVDRDKNTNLQNNDLDLEKKTKKTHDRKFSEDLMDCFDDVSNLGQQKEKALAGHERKFSEDLMDSFDDISALDHHIAETNTSHIAMATKSAAKIDNHENVILEGEHNPQPDAEIKMVPIDISHSESIADLSLERSAIVSICEISSEKVEKAVNILENNSKGDIEVQDTQAEESCGLVSPCELSIDSAASGVNELDINIDNRSDIDMFERSDELIAASNYEHLGLSGEEGSPVLVNESYQDLHIPYQSGQEKCFEKTDTCVNVQAQLRPAVVNNVGLNCISKSSSNLGDKPVLGQFSSQKPSKDVNYSRLHEDMAIALEMGDSFTSTFNSSAVGVENKKQATNQDIAADAADQDNVTDDHIGDSLTFSMMEQVLDGTTSEGSKLHSDTSNSNSNNNYSKHENGKISSNSNEIVARKENNKLQNENICITEGGMKTKESKQDSLSNADPVFQNDTISVSVLNSLEDETFVTPVKAPNKRLRETPVTRKQKQQKTGHDVHTDRHNNKHQDNNSLGECKKVLSAYEFHRHLEPSCIQPSNSSRDIGHNDKENVKSSNEGTSAEQATSPPDLNTSVGSDCVPPTPPGEGSAIWCPRDQGTPKRTPLCSLRSTFSPRLRAAISVGKYHTTTSKKSNKQVETSQMKKKKKNAGNSDVSKNSQEKLKTVKKKRNVRRNIEQETVMEQSNNKHETSGSEANANGADDAGTDVIPENIDMNELDGIITDDDKLCPSFIDPDESGLPLTQASFTIIDVCADKRLFKTFILEWRTKTRYAVSLACERKQLQPMTGGIGANFKKDSSPSKQAAEVGGIPLDTEGLMMVGLAVSWDNRDAYYVSFSHDAPQGDHDDTLAPPPSDLDISISIRLKAVKSVLQQAVCKRDSVTMVMFDVKAHFRALAEGYGFAPIGKFEDPKIACWMLDPGAREKNLHRMVTNLLPTEVHMLEGIGGGIGVSSLGMSPQNPGSGRYRATTECVLVRHLGEYFRKCLEKEGLHSVFTDVEMPSALTLCRMELNGFGFSQEESEYQKNIMIAKLSALEQKAYTLAGHPFSLSATEDIAQVLFVELLLPPNGDPSSGPVTRSLAPTMRSTVKKGRQRTTYSTSKDILEKLSKLHPLPGVILEWRRITNALTKTVFPLQKEKVLCERLSMYRIFCDCQLHTATGRVSLSEPNLQNVPKDFDITMPDLIGESPPPNAPSNRRSRGGSSRLRQMIGPQQVAMVTDEAGGTKFSVSMRHAFIPFQGGVLLAADYSQLELRMIAHLSGDQKLIQVLNADGDVFKLITAQWKNIKPEDVTPEERAQAKQVCYGMIYGIGPKALGEQLGVDENDAAVFIETFKAKYPSMRTYLRKTVETCREKGYVQTMMGRKRYLQHITATNPHARAQAERQAVNTTVQGSAADLVKMATIKIDQKLMETFPMTLYCHKHKLNSRQASSLSSPPAGAFLVLQLHDELIYEVSQSHVVQVATIVKNSMETAVKLPVKMPVKVKVGPSWGKLEDFTL